jgi:copper chaperone CopZ
MTENRSTAVLEVSGVQWASSKNVAEAVLSRRPGVMEVDANPVAQTATVTYDPSQTSVAELAGWVRDCGYHCAASRSRTTSAIPSRNLHRQRTSMIIVRPVTTLIMITARATTR